MPVADVESLTHISSCCDISPQMATLLHNSRYLLRCLAATGFSSGVWVTKGTWMLCSLLPFLLETKFRETL